MLSIYVHDSAQRPTVTVRQIDDRVAERFEERRRLRAVAYRMLGSLSEGEDALQERRLRPAGRDHGYTVAQSRASTSAFRRPPSVTIEAR